jgi:hypothetical protein
MTNFKIDVFFQKHLVSISVVDPKLFFSDPDPALGLISDPDPACLTKVIRLYKIK